MAKPGWQRRKDASLQDMGLRAAGLGLAFLILPLLLGASPLFKMLALGLRFPALDFAFGRIADAGHCPPEKEKSNADPAGAYFSGEYSCCA